MDTGTINVIMVGVGGQGIILASEILSEAALLAGNDVRKSEVHGMAQRGGSVSSHVRFGQSVKSPLIERGCADYMLAFEKVEGLRACDYLHDGATIIMNDQEIVPTTCSTGQSCYPGDLEVSIRNLGFKLVMVDAHHLAVKAGTLKAANVALLAALASFLDIGEDIWTQVIQGRVPKKYLDVNINAFKLGYEAARTE
jgi:indolepyruvate ferredoxin oxidoreductase, beta subunit